MPAKMAKSAPRPPFGLPERPVMRRQLASVLWQGRKTPILTPVRESSGESRFRELYFVIVMTMLPNARWGTIASGTSLH